ncbi:MAG: ribosome-associated translation inhibitor RaiA [Eggerthellaceae bacterium]|nr:ribosome-associated translation inhibitor RaiA [Eggerthellaceae bacterium]
MSITVSGRKMAISDSLREYATEKIGGSTKVMDINPLDVEVMLYREKNPANPRPACCEVTLRTKGHIIRAEEHEDDLHTAIDVAAAKVERQLRKFKTRVIDRKVQADRAAAEELIPRQTEEVELDLDQLMDELSDDEIVRVKEIEFAPMTQEEALVQIDLLGHDFFVFTERDTNLVCVLYRRDGGGYGLLRQAE